MWYRNVLSGLLAIVTIICQANLISAKDDDEAIRTIFLNIDKAYAENSVEKVMAYFSKNFSSGMVLTREKLEQGIGDFFSTWEGIRLKTKIKELKVVHNDAVVVTEGSVMARKEETGEELDVTRNTLSFLKNEDGHWRIRSFFKLESTNAMISGHKYTDNKLGYAVTKLPDWDLYKIELTDQPLILSSLLVLSPDISSSMKIGLLELPTPLSAQQAVEGDETATQSLATNYKLVSQDWTSFKGMKAYESLAEFTIKDEPIKRRRLYLVEDNLLVFILCDSSPERFSKINPKFDKILDSFSFLKRNEESIRDRVASEMAKGSISQNIYSNSEYGFQIAKPTAWKMNSASTKFLFQINITAPDEKSKVIFAAIKLPVQASAKDVVLGDEKATKSIAKDYALISEKKTIIAGEQGYETVTKFEIAETAMQRKRAYFVKDNIAYFFICDALPPAKFDEYAKEFDSVINSLTWNSLNN